MVVWYIVVHRIKQVSLISEMHYERRFGKGFSEVEMHARVVLGVGKGVLFRAVQECPQFRNVLIERERMHCMH